MSDKKSALFVCLGNICRSPIAAAVFKETVKEKQIAEMWNIDSAAIGSWHIGKSADRRAAKVLDKYNINYSHKARQIEEDDFKQFDYIFGMDNNNMDDLARLAPPDSKAKLLLFGSFDPKGERIIRDPYYDSNDIGFEKCYEQCLRSSEGFLESLK